MTDKKTVNTGERVNKVREIFEAIIDDMTLRDKYVAVLEERVELLEHSGDVELVEKMNDVMSMLAVLIKRNGGSIVIPETAVAEAQENKVGVGVGLVDGDFVIAIANSEDEFEEAVHAVVCRTCQKKSACKRGK